MNRFFRKTKGVISIFLAMVLLPVLSVAGIFIDISRRKQAEGLASTAADLTLNTVLSQYDAELSEYYGLLGSAQDMGDVIGATQNFMETCMVSSGMDLESARTSAENIITSFTKGDGDVHDIIKASLVETENSLVTPTDNMANPTILKTQIVEFMKYRGPVEIAKSVFDKLSKDDKAQKALENIEKETEMLNEREKFYEAEKKLKEVLFEIQANSYFSNYFSARDANKLDEKGIQLMAEELTSLGDIKASVKKDHVQMIMAMYSTKYRFFGKDQLLDIREIHLDTTGSGNGAYNSSSLASADQISSSLVNLDNKIKAFEKAAANLDSAWESVPDDTTDIFFEPRYVVYINEKTKSCVDALENAAYSMQDAYQTATSAVCNCEDDAAFTTYVSVTDTSGTAMNVYNYLSGAYGNCVATSLESGSTHRQIVNRLSNLLNYGDPNVKSQIQRGSFKDNGEIKSAIDDEQQLAKIIADYKQNVYNVQIKAGVLVEPAQEIKEYTKEYRDAFEAWKKAAFDPELDDSELALGADSSNQDSTYLGDREIIKAIEEASNNDNGNFTKPEKCTEADEESIKQSGVFLRNLTEKNAEEFNSRIVGVYDLFCELDNALSSLKYFEKTFADCTDFNTFYSAARVEESKLQLSENPLRKYAESSFVFSGSTGMDNLKFTNSDQKENLVEKDAEGNYVGFNISNNSHPDYDSRRIPNLYTFINNHEFKQVVEKEGERTMTEEDMKKKREEKTESADTSGNSLNTSEIKDTSDLPSAKYKEDEKEEKKKAGEKSSDLDTVNKFIGDMDIVEIIKNALVTGRDYLYVSEYVMNMFSYDTYEKEGHFNTLKSSDQKDVRAENPLTGIPTISEKYKSVDETWKNVSPQFTENKSLTNQLIDADHNWSYQNEVEYIIYGNGNVANKAAAYGSIYLLRYALDLAPVHREYYNDEVIESIAIAVNCVPPAFIPIPATKNLICLAITAAEAACDLAALKQGIPVPIYKPAGCPLYASFDSVFGGSSSNTVSEGTMSEFTYMQYSDYLAVFLYGALLINENAVYARIGDVIQTNMRFASINNMEGYRLSKANVYYKLDAVVRVKPMMSTWSVLGLDKMAGSNYWNSFKVSMVRGYS